MKRVLFSVLAFLFLSLPATSQDWMSVARKVSKSLVALETAEGQNYCTGFVINNEQNYIATAGHCIVDEETGEVYIPYVDKVQAKAVTVDPTTDFAVVVVDVNKPALKPSHKTIQIGMPVMSVGFAYGFEVPQFRPTFVAGLENDLEDPFGSGFLAFSNSLVGGQSGGPIVDRDGNVIAMNQVADSRTGWGRPVSKFLAKFEVYWKR